MNNYIVNPWFAGDDYEDYAYNITETNIDYKEKYLELIKLMEQLETPLKYMKQIESLLLTDEEKILHPQTTESAVPQTTESAVPQTTQSVVPQTTQSVVPQTTQSVVPQTTPSVPIDVPTSKQKNCGIKPSKIVYIYHIANQRISNYNNSNYIYQFIDKNTNVNMESIIMNRKDCDNVYIYIDSGYESKITRNINEQLSRITKDDFKLLNITIVNRTKSIKAIIYSFPNKFKKIINIFPTCENIKTCKEFTFNSNINRKISSTITTDVEKCVNNWSSGYNIVKFNECVPIDTDIDTDNIKITEENISDFYNKQFDYRIMNTPNNNAEKIDDTWWFKYYFDTPLCAYGRLLQSSGTCWCNVIINILILCPFIVKILVSKFEEQKRKNVHVHDSFESLQKSNPDLKTYLFGFINILLVNKQKAKFEDKNVVINLASKIKCEYEKEITPNENINCNDPSYGDGGDSFFGIRKVFDTLLTKNIDYVVIQKKNRIPYIFNKLTYDEQTRYVLIEKRLKELNNGTLLWNNVLYDKEVDNTISPSILLIDYAIFGGKIKPNTEITVSGITYTLEASNIDVNIKHAIAGLKCEDKYYIYDSNNFITYSDWNELNYTNYENLIKLNKVEEYYQNTGNNFDIIFLIYIKKINSLL